MSDIQEEQKRLYKRAEENDIKLLKERIDFLIDRNDEKEDRINKVIVILNNIYLLDNVSITNNAVKEIDKAINILQGKE